MRVHSTIRHIRRRRPLPLAGLVIYADDGCTVDYRHGSDPHSHVQGEAR